MIRYRIYTEDTDYRVGTDVARREIAEFITDYAPGFTIFRAWGYWKGAPEKTLVIEILVDPSEPDSLGHDEIAHIARWIKTRYFQESVLVTIEETIQAEFI